MGSYSEIILANKRIVYFDGYCNLCSGIVQWLIRIDKSKLLYFSTLDSISGKNLILKSSDSTAKNTILFQYKDELYVRSDAVLQIVKVLGYPWSIMHLFSILPRSIRDWMYDVIAKNRYNWFGRKKECMVPDREILNRFL